MPALPARRPTSVHPIRAALVRPVLAAFVLAAACAAGELRAQEATAPIGKGQRVLSAGHSFHVFMPRILTDLAAKAKIEGHRQLAVSSIGGSRTIQHWNKPDEQNIAKKTLGTGEVDVMTIAPIYLPDEGIGNFVRLAHEKNPACRVTIQEFWLPYDVYAPNYQTKRPEPADRNARTSATMRAEHQPYFDSIDAHVKELNAKFDQPCVFVVPCGQAAILLREKILAGEAPGLAKQGDLFTDAIGHATSPLQMLTAYCHFAVIYRRSPVGLPTGLRLPTVEAETAAKLDRLLQELAWQAVVAHPLSGVKETKAAQE